MIEFSESVEDFKAGKPGIYLGIPEEVYHGHELSVSRSLLVKHAVTSAHALDYMTKNQASTKAMRRGTAFDTLLLEPDKFDERFHVFPEGIQFRSNADKAIRDEAFAKYGEDRCIKYELMQEAKQMVAATLTDDDAYDLLRNTNGWPQVSVLFVHDATGLLCRCRIDWLTETGVVCDIKSDKDPSKFSFSIRDYHLHVQFAMYHYALGLFGIEPKEFVALVQNNTAPIVAPAYYLIGGDTMALGWDDFEKYIHRHKWCLDNDRWPGYTDKPTVVDLPQNYINWRLQEVA